jgi:hypothetical protein
LKPNLQVLLFIAHYQQSFILRPGGDEVTQKSGKIGIVFSMPNQENDMHKTLYAALFAALLPTACYVVPTDRGDNYVIAPALPVVVELGVEPYYYHSGFYYYYHDQDRRWNYSRARTGPWKELPRDRYPREIRYKDRDRDRDWDRDRR